MKSKLMGWQPEHANNRLAFVIGSLAGIWKFITNVHLLVGFESKLLEGVIMAGLCGFAGMAGKWLFGVVKQFVIEPAIEYFKNRKLKNNGNPKP